MSSLRGKGGRSEGWKSGRAVILNSEIVRVHLNLEEASLSPIRAPGIATDPVLSL